MKAEVESVRKKVDVMRCGGEKEQVSEEVLRRAKGQSDALYRCIFLLSFKRRHLINNFLAS